MAGKTRKEQLEELLALEPNDPELHYGLAMEYASAGDDAGAVDRFRQMFATVPDYAPAYHQAGLALVRLGRLEEARAVLNQGIGVARQIGNLHAAEEMQGLLGSLG
jgi:Flp pilus assembly protein TadD